MQVAIDNLADVLTRCPHFNLLRSLCKDSETYVVGGAVRDALLNRPISDLDLISPYDPTTLAKKFARQIGGHWFWLDEGRCQSRVVVNDLDSALYYDFALFRAPDLTRDQLDRDFTINALALPLSGDLSINSLFDPCNGLEDLRQGRLRMVSSDSLPTDPLRVLKGLRHATTLGLLIDPATKAAMGTHSGGLKMVAPERVRQEVWKILEASETDRGLQLLCDSGVGDVLFGSDWTDALPDLLVTLSNCRGSWRQLTTENDIVSSWLAHELEQGLKVETLLLMFFLLRLISPDLPFNLAVEWRLSRKAREGLSAMANLTEGTVKELSSVARNERAYAWWAAFHHIEPKLLFLALVVIGSGEAGLAPAEINAWVPFVSPLDGSRPADLVDGNWLSRELSIKEGPEMSKALEMVRSAEISGVVNDGDSAKKYLSNYYQNKL
jgi:tRNA nucleotidyltransferase/poly(A) polymerase